MMQIAYMLVGAGLVVLGVLTGALADRIRGIKAQRGAKFWNEPGMPRKPQRDTAPGNPTEIALSRDVTAALVQAGYSKREAVEAVGNVPSSACSTLESWTRAALKKLASQSASVQ